MKSIERDVRMSFVRKFTTGALMEKIDLDTSSSMSYPEHLKVYQNMDEDSKYCDAQSVNITF